jgi:hypothetical protein
VPPIGSTPASKPGPMTATPEPVGPAHSRPLPPVSEGEPVALASPIDEPPAPLPGNGPATGVPMEPSSSPINLDTPETRPTVGSSVGGVFPALPDLQGAANSAVMKLQNVASGIANVFETLLDSSSGSSELPADGEEESPSKGTPQPATPFVPPIGGSLFSLAGSGQVGTNGGAGPLLLGVLILGLVLLRPRGNLSRVFCEAPKPSSVLLLPLERPG